jgi:TonB family protein
MFLRHFGLLEQPFGATPDPRFFYSSASHREALTSVITSIDCERGFSLLIGEPGFGKTTLLYALLKRYAANARTAFVSSIRGENHELIRHILTDFEVETPEADVAGSYGAFRDMLVSEARAGRRVILFMDEAHEFSAAALDTVRLLSNFEVATAKHLHIVLAGQPQLNDTLRDPDLASLQQRITTTVRLRRLTGAEVAQYIEYRLHTAGAGSTPLFTPQAANLIAEQSRGIPREINRLAYDAMTLASALERSQVDEEVLREVKPHYDREDAREPEHDRRARVIPLSRTRAIPAPSPSTAMYTWGSLALAISPAREEERKLKPVETPVQSPATVIKITDPIVALRSELQTEPFPSEPVSSDRRRVFTAALVAGASLLLGGLGLLERSARSSQHGVAQTVVTRPDPATQIASAAHPLATSKRKPQRKHSANDAKLRPPSSFSTTHEGQLPPLALSEKSDNSEIQPLVPPPLHGSPSSDLKESTSAPVEPSALANGSTSRPRTGVDAATVPVTLSPQVTPAVARLRVQPVYPPSLKAQHVEGTVRMQVHVDKIGRVIGVTILSGDHRLAPSAQDAVRKWVFSPVLQDGNPIDGYTQVNVRFTAAK